MPRISLTPAVNSAAFEASLVALVATMRTDLAPEAEMVFAYSVSIAKVRASACRASFPVASTPWPSLTISIRRCRSTSSPVPG